MLMEKTLNLMVGLNLEDFDSRITHHSVKFTSTIYITCCRPPTADRRPPITDREAKADFVWCDLGCHSYDFWVLLCCFLQHSTHFQFSMISVHSNDWRRWLRKYSGKVPISHGGLLSQLKAVIKKRSIIPVPGFSISSLKFSINIKKVTIHHRFHLFDWTTGEVYGITVDFYNPNKNLS